MSIRRLIGVGFLAICLALIALPVLGGFSMAGFHGCLAAGSALAGLAFLIS